VAPGSILAPVLGRYHDSGANGSSRQCDLTYRDETATEKTAAKLRSRRVIIMRSRGEYLGSVEAPDRESAEAVAIKQFDLDQDQRGRLLIRERD
jgi:hypothetical protein